MLFKESEFKVDRFSTYNDTLSGNFDRVKLMPDIDGELGIMLISNTAEDYIFDIYGEDGSKRVSFSVDTKFGEFFNIQYYNGLFWLEFHEYVSLYHEDYCIVAASASGDSVRAEVVAVFTRESYAHNQLYHSLYISPDGLRLNIIRHNRMHHYEITAEGAEELDIMIGEKWFLCGEYALSVSSQMIELYDISAHACHILDCDITVDIDTVQYAISASGDIFAFAATDDDLNSILVVYQHDIQLAEIEYLENKVWSVGIASDRIWLNPFSGNTDGELGGCIIYDKNPILLYSHIRAINHGDDAAAIGVAPIFQRCDKFIEMPNGMILAIEGGAALLIDYACQLTQRLGGFYPGYIAALPYGEMMVSLDLNRDNYLDKGETEFKDASIAVYKWSEKITNATTEQKIIDMADFKRV